MASVFTSTHLVPIPVVPAARSFRDSCRPQVASISLGTLGRKSLTTSPNSIVFPSAFRPPNILNLINVGVQTLATQRCIALSGQGSKSIPAFPGNVGSNVGWKTTVCRNASPEAGSLVEKLDAEVIPVVDSDSGAKEAWAEAQKRIGEAESSGKLDLSGLRLRELPSGVFDITGLTELSLAGNQITELDPAIKRLTSLAKLGLAGNKLRRLPAEVGTLRYLKGLWVHGNLLESLPPEIGQLKYLGILALGGNRLRSLPEELSCLTSLTSLSVPGNRLETLDALTCGRPLPELRALGLFGNRLRTVPEGVLGRFPGLTELWLQGNHLTQLPDSAADWAALKSLKQLSIADNVLTSLPDALSSLPSLKDLWVYGNHLKTIPKTLVDTPKLTHLWLEGNPLESANLEGALSRVSATKLARKIVIGIDQQQAQGLSAGFWGQGRVRECVTVSSTGASGTGPIGRDGYFKLELGVPVEVPRGDGLSGLGASGRQSGGAGSLSGGTVAEATVGQERQDALIFNYASMQSSSTSAFGQTTAEDSVARTSSRGNPIRNGLGAEGRRSAFSQWEQDGRSSGPSGDLRPRKGLVVIAFGSAPGVPNWAGVLKRVRAALKPDSKKRPSNLAGPSPKTTTFDVLYVVDARRSWYTQIGSSAAGSETSSSETRGAIYECKCPPAESSNREGAGVSKGDDLQLEGDFRIGTDGHASAQDGPDSPLERVRSKVASRSTLLDAEDLGIAAVSTRDPFRQGGAFEGRDAPPERANSSGSFLGDSRVVGAERSAGVAVGGVGERPYNGMKHNASAGRAPNGNGREQDGGQHRRDGADRYETARLSEVYRSELGAAVHGYERVLLLGDSMGASASLLFSTLATRVLSFCPQVDLSTASIRCAEDDTWFGRFRDEVLNDVSASSGVITVHCGCWLHDLEQAALLPAGKVTVVEHPVEDHRLAKELDYQGKLVPILRTAIEEELLLLTSEQH